MPVLLLAPLAIPLAVAGVSALAGAYANWRNNRNQKKQNKADREFQERMYDKQRADALADFERANAFNSPIQIMRRYKEAGINPNLVYGNASGATAAPIRSSTPTGGNQTAPSVDGSFVGTSAQSYLASQQTMAQTENLSKQGVLMDKEGLLKDATTAKTLQETARSKFDLSQASDLRQDVITRAKLENSNLAADLFSKSANTGIALERNEREKLSNAVNVASTLESILTARLGRAKTRTEIDQLKVMIDNAKNSGELQKLDLNLRRNGISPNDPAWMRVMSQFLEGQKSDDRYIGGMSIWDRVFQRY